MQIPKFTVTEFSAVSPNFSPIFNVLQDLWALSIFIAGQSWTPTPNLKMFRVFRLFHSLLSLSHSASLSSPLTSALSATLSSATSLRRCTPFPLSASLRPFQVLSFLHQVFTPPTALSSLSPSEFFPLNIPQLPSQFSPPLSFNQVSFSPSPLSL